jgi:hydrogen cyanide synthase HcnC
MDRTPTGTTQHYDVIVVGGGIVGAAIGWGAAARGARVALVDQGDVAVRASRANLGLVWVQGKGEGRPAYAQLTRQSAALWPELAARLLSDTGVDVSFRQPGGAHFCLGDEEFEERRELVARTKTESGDIGLRMVDRTELQAMMPLAVGPKVTGASYCPSDGHVNPLRLLRAFHAGLQALGSSYLPGNTVEAVHKDGDAFVVACTSRRLVAEKIVIAAGLGSRSLAPLVGLSMPVTPLKGQILVTERVAKFSDLYLGSLRQTDEGSIMIGSSRLDQGFDEIADVAPARTMAARCIACLPALSDLQVVRTWTGLRIMTPDGFPIYDASEQHPGAFAVTCHSGVTLAALHALHTAPEIVAGAFHGLHRDFSASRFNAAAQSPVYPRH